MKNVTVLDIINAISEPSKNNIEVRNGKGIDLINTIHNDRVHLTTTMLSAGIYEFLNSEIHLKTRKVIESLPINLKKLINDLAFRNVPSHLIKRDTYDQTIYIFNEPSGITTLSRPKDKTSITINKPTYSIYDSITKGTINICNELLLNSMLFEDQWKTYRRIKNLSAFGISIESDTNAMVAKVIVDNKYDIDFTLESTQTYDAITINGSQFYTTTRNGVVRTDMFTKVDLDTAIDGNIYLERTLRNRLKIYLHLINQIPKE